MYLAENIRVPKDLYERVADISDFKKYVGALLMIIFDRDTLATHCLQGRKNNFTGEDSHKPPLPPEILKSLMGEIKNTSQNSNITLCSITISTLISLIFCNVFFSPLQIMLQKSLASTLPRLNMPSAQS